MINIEQKESKCFEHNYSGIILCSCPAKIGVTSYQYCQYQLAFSLFKEKYCLDDKNRTLMTKKSTLSLDYSMITIGFRLITEIKIQKQILLFIRMIQSIWEDTLLMLVLTQHLALHPKINIPSWQGFVMPKIKFKKNEEERIKYYNSYANKNAAHIHRLKIYCNYLNF